MERSWAQEGESEGNGLCLPLGMAATFPGPLSLSELRCLSAKKKSSCLFEELFVMGYGSWSVCNRNWQNTALKWLRSSVSCVFCFYFFLPPKKVLLSFVPVLLNEMLLMKLNGLSFLWEGLSRCD